MHVYKYAITLLHMHVYGFSSHRIWANLTHRNNTIQPVESIINNII